MLNVVSSNTTLSSYHFTQTSNEIPIIDISPLINGSVYHNQCLIEIEKACRETGFFAIKNFGVDPKLYQQLMTVAKTFFNQSEKFKRRYQIGLNGRHCGYVPLTENGLCEDEANKRLYEAFDLSLDLPASDPDHQRGNIFYGPVKWPEIKNFHLTVKQYFQQVRNLSHILTTAFEKILGMPDGFMLSKMHKPTSQLRLIHYLQNQAHLDNVDINMGAHTDYELFTILFADKTGLQTQNLNGEWIDVPVMPDTLTINIGDMLEVWSDGIFKSNLHRVINQGQERYSFPYFASLDYDTVVSPFKKKQTEKQIRVPRSTTYQPIKAGEHLLQQVTRDFAYLRRQFVERSNSFLLNQRLDINPFQNTVTQPRGEQ
ncbi:isopenicillin N synthase family dioxygenase [Aliikangiella maris]|uniref:2OG-Fe(II) oxygenase family protein n=2 Tax=Aliikangiella maris TaxID=3162458 RepID=A0ABV2BVP7_9GAMM